MKLILFVLAFAVSAANADLVSTFRQELRKPLASDWRALEKQLADKLVVFVAIDDWFFVPLRAFKDNRFAVEGDIGAATATVMTSFFKSYEDNAAHLAAEFARLHKESGKKLIVIGNPQSGPDSLVALLKNTNLLTSGAIERIVLVQPAFGTPVVDMVVQGKASKDLAWAVRRYFGISLEKFETAKVRKLFGDALAALTAEERTVLNAKLYFARSASTPLRVTPIPVVEVPYMVLRNLGPTDGISMTKDQKLDGIGTDLGVVPADHWDLFGSLPASNSRPAYRRAFTRALLREVLK